MKPSLIIGTSLLAIFAMASVGRADLVLGVISNFQDGTVQGWTGGTVDILADSGPEGIGDFAAELSNGGIANNFAMFNTGVAGAIDPPVAAIAADFLRPQGDGSAEMRLVLFDSGGTRWTSTSAITAVDDGTWHHFTFSILEANLTRVVGGGTYANLTDNLDRIMFRYDPDAPSGGGNSLNGTVLFDNITAVPEPSSCLVLAGALLGGMFFRRRKSVDRSDLSRKVAPALSK